MKNLKLVKNSALSSSGNMTWTFSCPVLTTACAFVRPGGAGTTDASRNRRSHLDSHCSRYSVSHRFCADSWLQVPKRLTAHLWLRPSSAQHGHLRDHLRARRSCYIYISGYIYIYIPRRLLTIAGWNRIHGCYKSGIYHNISMPLLCVSDIAGT